MRRWLDESQYDEPFFGFEGSRPAYIAYQPVVDWGAGEPADTSMHAESGREPRVDQSAT